MSGWTEITAVSAGLWHTVGRRADGTLVACGDNSFGQCDVSEWTDIIAVDCGACYTLGLRSDGTVLAAGDNSAGQCDVSEWTEIAGVAAGAYHTVAVRMDGTVISCGMIPEEMECGQLFESEWITESEISDTQVTAGSATPYMEGMDREKGPWLYLDTNGAVLVCLDESEAKIPFRADLIATSSHIPEGKVTTPEASGRIIRMVSELPQEQAAKAHAVLGFTGDYIGFTSNGKGVMIRNGIIYYDRAERNSAALLPDGTIALYDKGAVTAQQLLDIGVRDCFSFGPILVKDGALQTQKVDDTFTMRVVLGYSDPYHYIVLVGQRDRIYQLTFRQAGEICVRYGCRNAYNLDGGHSTSLVFMGKELSHLSNEGKPHSNIRGLSDIVIFLQNENVGMQDADGPDDQ